MAQDQEFVTYVLAQLELASAVTGLPTKSHHHFNAASFSLGGDRVALIVNNTLFMHLNAEAVRRWLPDTQPLQPAGVSLDSQFYPVPLAWLGDVDRLSDCLQSAISHTPCQKATA